MRSLIASFLVCLVPAALTGCIPADEPADAPAAPPTVQPMETPAAPGSGLSHLFTAADGRVYLSWTEPVDSTTSALRFATTDGTAWSEPVPIAEGADWFVNWADFPAISASPDGFLVAHFLQRSGAGTYFYDVRVTRSTDGGATWSEPITPHTDGVPAEHGFVSLVPLDTGGVFMTWLDGRHTGNDGGAMTLRTATMDRTGALTGEAELDARVCDCCQTAAARTSDGLLVAYRDRSEQEVRDIALVRYEDGAWTEPYRLHDDGWEIAGCPVNGPALAAEGATVAAAWFTGAGDVPRTKVAFSSDAGRTFGPAFQVDEAPTLGRVDVVLLNDGRALVSWLASTGDDAAAVRLRVFTPDGPVAPAFTAASTSAARASGFPRMTRSGDTVYLAWTEVAPDGALQVRTARIATSALPPPPPGSAD